MRIPRFARWLLYNSLFFLILMFILRIVLWQTMMKEGLAHSSMSQILILGFRYDARIIAIVGILLLVLSFIKPLHPFESKAGKKVSFFLWGLATFLLCFFYAVDFANYAYLSQRLNASLMNYMEDTAISLGMIWQSYHIIYILLGIVVSFLFNSIIPGTCTCSLWPGRTISIKMERCICTQQRLCCQSGIESFSIIFQYTGVPQIGLRCQ